MATIGTHCGHTLSQGHNRRDEAYTSKDGHVRSDGYIEIWRDEKLQDAYARIFDEALQAYNQKQTREDRRISEYLSKVRTDAQKHEAYEMIIGVYKCPEASDEVKKEILKEFVNTWSERNPNMEMIGAYYHADEDGEPHVHIDYIPIAKECKRGLETQNSYKRALEQMGYTNPSRRCPPIVEWTKENNKYLEELCKKRGIDVEHNKEKKKNLSMREYQEMQEALKKELKKVDQEQAQMLEKDFLGRYTKRSEETIQALAKASTMLKKASGEEVSLETYPQVWLLLKKQIEEAKKKIENLQIELGKEIERSNHAYEVQRYIDNFEINKLEEENSKLKEKSNKLEDEILTMKKKYEPERLRTLEIKKIGLEREEFSSMSNSMSNGVIPKEDFDLEK